MKLNTQTLPIMRQAGLLAVALMTTIGLSSCGLFKGWGKGGDGDRDGDGQNLASYRMKSGSVVALQMFEVGRSVLDTDLTVDLDGDLLVPNVGEVSVDGMAPLDAAKEVEVKARRPGQSHLSGPRVHIKALDSRAVVYVTGEVKRSGAVAFHRGMTVAEAIKAVGGTTEGGNARSVGLSSEGRRKIIMNPETRVLKEGEVVNVPRRP